MPSIGSVADRGLGVIGRRSAARGDVFSRVNPISVFGGEFCCSATSFSGIKALGKGLPYGNGIQVANYLFVTYLIIQKYCFSPGFVEICEISERSGCKKGRRGYINTGCLRIGSRIW